MKPGLARAVFALLLACLPWLAGGARGQVGSEAQLKAAFLISFMKYVDWPHERSVLRLCVRARDPVSAYLAPYQGRAIGQRSLDLRSLADGDTPVGCDQLYLSDTEAERERQWLQQAKGQPTLVSADGEASLGRGASIALVRGEGRLHFDISMAALALSGLKVGTPMLRLARRSVGAEGGGR